jgi:hypothetical protein
MMSDSGDTPSPNRVLVSVLALWAGCHVVQLVVLGVVLVTFHDWYFPHRDAAMALYASGPLWLLLPMLVATGLVWRLARRISRKTALWMPLLFFFSLVPGFLLWLFVGLVGGNR